MYVYIEIYLIMLDSVSKMRLSCTAATPVTLFKARRPVLVTASAVLPRSRIQPFGASTMASLPGTGAYSNTHDS